VKVAVPQELKHTLNLPKTEFSMKANLPQNEPKQLERWEQMRIYDRIRQARQGAPKYVLHDGPPYANGPIHLGHALNKCLKDFVVKSKTMSGHDAPYVPGWDCHGLPIEIKVDESLGRKKLEMDPLQVRMECRKYAQKYLDLQREQFKRLGVFGDWDQPYVTMNARYESVVVRLFYDFLEKGMVYKGLKPVYWCIHDGTALAEAEVEYANHTSPSIWVKYELTSDPAKIDPALAGKKVSTIIWTTTPWTLPASLAVAFHPEEEYVALEHGEDVFIVAQKLAEATQQVTTLQGAQEIAKFPGAKLDRVTFKHPFLGRQILGVLADYVTMDQGTGAVHTAPSHGADDFYTGVKYGLDPTCNVDDSGRLHNGLPEYEGNTVFAANKPIIELLKTRGVLMGLAHIEHSYPHCWRCHNPVIFRATEQWFIGMESALDGNASASGKAANSTLRERALEEIKRVKWDPAWGEERIANMIATRPDWCISRQRIWGVPIAVFFCRKCNELVNDPKVNQAVVDLFARDGADAWYKSEPQSIMPAGTKCAKCGESDFRKEMDIIDVWFESGSSHAAVIGSEPADLYLEGGDQYRGWFHSSLLCEVGSRNQSPYRSVATNGWTLDEQGRAMSKSLGNGVDPVEIADKMGGEIVRLWVASVDFREDVRCSDNLMQRVAENYRKIRNTIRAMLGNLYDFDATRDAVPFAEMEQLDQYMLGETAALTRDVLGWYQRFEFHRIYHGVIAFCASDLSNVYIDVLKDRLYTCAPNDKRRRSGQTALWRICEALTLLLAPIMSFTADEIWRHLPQTPGRPESVHLAGFPDPQELAPGLDSSIQSDWKTLLALRDEVMKPLEEARNRKLIGKGLDAQVAIAAAEPAYSVLKRHQGDLRYLYLVSQVKLAQVAGNGNAPINVTVAEADGQKCERCWNYSVHVGENKQYPSVCERCSAALEQIGGER
jgi:isoleucyl-tRNA synthetase